MVRPAVVVIVIVVIISLVAVAVVVALLYIRHNTSKSPDPKGITAQCLDISKAGNGEYLFNWTDSNGSTVAFNTSVSQNGTVIVSASNLTKSTWQISGLPTTGQLVFSVTARGYGMYASKATTITFTAGQHYGSVTPEVYLITSSSGQDIYGGKTDSISKVALQNNICKSLGGTPTTQSQFLDAFNSGLSQCFFSPVMKDDGTDVYSELPSYYADAGSDCYVPLGGKPRLVIGQDPSFTGMACYGAKPPNGTPVTFTSATGSTFTDTSAVHNFSNNTSQWSRYSTSSKSPLFTCTTPNDVCNAYS